MLTNWVLKKTLKGEVDYKAPEVRNKVGYLSGLVGIFINVFLFILKFIIGLICSSVAILADAFNNLSDAASSIITIIGFKLSSKPADKEHPYGHGRIEYISALVIVSLVLVVGFQFIKTSISRIISPAPVTFAWLPFVLLLLSIFFKWWLSHFNRVLGNKINSQSLKATATDAMGDVFTTSVVVISFLASRFTRFPIDGYVGTFVALAILYAGFNLIKETLNPLIGEAPDEELVHALTEGVLAYDHITGVHDLIVHNYGPGRIMASLHAEIPADIPLMTIHDIIDTAERELSEKLRLHLVIHMDPICVTSEEVAKVRSEVDKIIRYNPLIQSMHDFRFVGEGEKKNLLFDIVVDAYHLDKVLSAHDLKQSIIDAIQEEHPDYNCIITIDKCYLHEPK
ncbi:cation-efflux pump [Sporanaerobium hydrogeniformans]|uniref:Cation-efflux pump n=1 Tax=Sporanaerobium hydrogeniformans TaxID=3072179 RepID=A0AC61DE13_9FIRM|nr:cation diffusion facilitator family transporter [Sporanaerobium hydrogeniformans]PHV70976.1 cation-efflux pump [Sporanaerobium hydrogeniformans]